MFELGKGPILQESAASIHAGLWDIRELHILVVQRSTIN
jgi:hypothetical protein